MVIILLPWMTILLNAFLKNKRNKVTLIIIWFLNTFHLWAEGIWLTLNTFLRDDKLCKYDFIIILHVLYTGNSIHVKMNIE